MISFSTNLEKWSQKETQMNDLEFVCTIKLNLFAKITHLPDVTEHRITYFVRISLMFASNFNMPWSYAGPTTGLTTPNIILHKGDDVKAANEIDVKKSLAIPHYNHILLRTQCLSSQEHLPSCLMRN